MQTFNDAQVADMIGEVETAIQAVLKSEATTLRKSESMNSAGNGGPGAGSPLGKTDPDASAAPVQEGSAPADESAPPADASASPAPDASPSPDASPAPAGDPAAAQQDAPPSKEELDAAYAGLSLPELEMHIQCATQALAAKQSQMGGGAPASPSAAPAPAMPSASPAGAPGANPLPADQSPPLAPAAAAALKSENAVLRGQVEELTKSVSAFLEGFKGMVKPQAPANPQVNTTAGVIQFIPAQKAVTSMDTVPQAAAPVSLSKAEINEKLKTVVRKPELTKNERKLITRWYQGDATEQDIAPLLK